MKIKCYPEEPFLHHSHGRRTGISWLSCQEQRLSFRYEQDSARLSPAGSAGRTVEAGWQSQSNRHQALVAEADSWFKAVRQFRQAELSELVLREPGPRDLRFHRAYLAQVIAAGEQLAILSDLNGLPENPAGITLESIEAELESLYHTQAGYHGGMTAGRKKQILEEVFGEPQSSA